MVRVRIERDIMVQKEAKQRCYTIYVTNSGYVSKTNVFSVMSFS